MVLPAGIAPATVSFEASCADLLRYGSLKVIAHGPRSAKLTFSSMGKPAVDSGGWPGAARDMRDTSAGLGEKSGMARQLE
jgi:hypothetical protein